VRHKIDLGSGLVALGALGVLISLFLDWYAPHLTAFDAFEVVDWMLASLAVVTLGGLSLAARDAVPVPPWLVVAVLAAVVLVFAQVIDPPPDAHGAARQAGAWLAVGSAALMAIGVALATASISVTVDVRGRERRRRVPAVDRREAAASPPREPDAAPPRPAAAASRAGSATPRPATSPPPREPDLGAPPRTAPGDPDRTQPLRPLEPRPPGPGTETSGE